jgi:hypothetical protein
MELLMPNLLEKIEQEQKKRRKQKVIFFCIYYHISKLFTFTNLTNQQTKGKFGARYFYEVLFVFAQILGVHEHMGHTLPQQICFMRLFQRRKI